MPSVTHDSIEATAIARADQDCSVSRALSQGLGLPLTALRATVESLGHELRGGPVRCPSRRIDGVLQEMERLDRNVGELIALATAPVPRPLRCTLAELVHAARMELGPAQAARVVVAQATGHESLLVDGPLLSSCLRRLLENALEAGSEHVLVVARLERSAASFSVIDDAPSAFGPDWKPVPFRSTKPNHLGLGLVLAHRDVALLNGRLEFLSTPGGETCVRITIPAPSFEEEER